MKKVTLFLLLLAVSTTFSFAQWQKLNLTKAAGGTINLNINRLSLDGGKLYAATFDGIWVSPSANGGDWEPFGLQGLKVTHLSFGVLKLAVVSIVATNDATKTASQLYKLDGSTWVKTKLNETAVSTFGGPSNAFTQIQDAGNKTVIFVPSWGGGIWRSDDGGEVWTNYAQGTTNDGAVYKNVLGLFTFPGNTTIYGTDKVATNFNYIIYSEDFGATWKNSLVGAFFNPHSVLARKYKGSSYLFYGGQNGNDGIVWRSADIGVNWDASLTVGVPYWEIRKIIGEDEGAVYALSSVNNVYVSTDNGDQFNAVGTGITIPATRTAPASGTFYLSDLIKSDKKLYVSAVKDDGIYYFDLSTDAINFISETRLNCYPNPVTESLSIQSVAGAKISIYSLTGKLVKTASCESGITSLDVKSFKPSAYIVKVQSPDGKQVAKQFFKK